MRRIRARRRVSGREIVDIRPVAVETAVCCVERADASREVFCTELPLRARFGLSSGRYE